MKKTYTVIKNAKEILTIQHFLIDKENIYINLKDIKELWQHYGNFWGEEFLKIDNYNLEGFIEFLKAKYNLI